MPSDIGLIEGLRRQVAESLDEIGALREQVEELTRQLLEARSAP